MHGGGMVLIGRNQHAISTPRPHPLTGSGLFVLILDGAQPHQPQCQSVFNGGGITPGVLNLAELAGIQVFALAPEFRMPAPHGVALDECQEDYFLQHVLLGRLIRGVYLQDGYLAEFRLVFGRQIPIFGRADPQGGDSRVNLGTVAQKVGQLVRTVTGPDPVYPE